jgi:hypothetical protein
VIFLGDFVIIFLKNYRVTMTTTLNAFGKYNGFVSKARVSACMYFLVHSYKFVANSEDFTRYLTFYGNKIQNIWPSGE